LTTDKEGPCPLVWKLYFREFLRRKSIWESQNTW